MSSSAVWIVERLKRAWLGKNSSVLARRGDVFYVEGSDSNDEDELFAAFDRTAVGAALIASDGKLIKINHWLCEMLGYTSQELMESGIHIVAHPEEKYEWNHLNHIFAKTSDPVCVEQRYLHKAGHTIWASMIITPIRNNQERTLSFFSQFHDVTRYKQTEDAFRKNQRLLQGIIEGTPDAVFVKDCQGRYLIANAAGARLMGKTEEEIIGKSDLELFPPEEASRVMETDRQVKESGEAKIYELAITIDGITRAFLFTKTPYLGLNGETLGVVVVARDITDHQRAAENLENSRAELRALSARLQSVREEERMRIAREIHDELGQVLTGLKIDVVSLAKKMSESPSKADWNQLKERTQSIANLINNAILTVRKISTELRPGLLDAVGLTAAIEWQAKEFEKRTGIKCKLKLPLENVALDQHRSIAIFRIFQEILTNVARHSQATEVSVIIEEKDADLILEAKDNGRGIRASEFSNPKSLGLLGMRERALLLGGEVSIRGIHEKGTIVIVRIPLVQKLN